MYINSKYSPDLKPSEHLSHKHAPVQNALGLYDIEIFRSEYINTYVNTM